MTNVARINSGGKNAARIDNAYLTPNKKKINSTWIKNLNAKANI